MAQHKQLTWTELRVGLFVLAATVLLVVVIFYVTGAGALGPKYRLHAFLPEVDGLTVGAPVRVDGVDVGNVEKNFYCPCQSRESSRQKTGVSKSICASRRLFRITSARTPSAGLITEGLLGNRYVDIDRGFVGRTLQNDEEIPGREEKALKAVVERSADLMQNLSSITEKGKRSSR